MKFLLGFCSFLSGVLGIYSFVIFIRIIFSWAVMFVQRNRNYNFNAGYEQQDGPTFVETVDSILGKICDPYLNLFRGLRFLRVGMFDLSPAVALCLLIAPHPFWEILRRRTHSRWADFWQPCCILCGRSSHPFWDF